MINPSANIKVLYLCNGTDQAKVALDSSGLGRNATLREKEFSLSTDGVVSNGYDLAYGGGEYLQIDSEIVDLGANHSVIIWYHKTIAWDGVAYWWCSSGTSRFYIYPLANYVRLYYPNGSYVQYASSDFPANEYVWHMITVTKDSADAYPKIYVDANLKTKVSSGSNMPSQTLSIITIGDYRTHPGNRFLLSDIDIFAAFNKELNTDEIDYFYNDRNGMERLTNLPIAIHNYKMAGAL